MSKWDFTSKWVESRRLGSTVHLEAQMAAWLAGMDRENPSWMTRGAWQPMWTPNNQGDVTACRWEWDHFSRVVCIPRRGLTEKMLLNLTTKFVNCPECLVLVDAILETKR